MAELSSAFADLDELGFCVVPDVLDAGTIAEIRDRVLEQAELERERAVDVAYQAEAEDDDVNQWVYQLLNKGSVFWQLPIHPTARALAQHVLGKQHLLSTFDAHITYPGNKPMPMHADQWWMPPPVAPGAMHVRQGDITRSNGPNSGPEPAAHPITPPLIVNIMWMMSDFTLANGATRVVPRSHLSGATPTAGERYDEVVLEGSAGSVAVWDGRTWHGAGLNTTDHGRVGITTYFSGPMVRSLSNSTLGLRSDTKRELPEELLALVGFRPFSSYGMTDDPYAKIASPGDETLGELRR